MAFGIRKFGRNRNNNSNVRRDAVLLNIAEKESRKKFPNSTTKRARYTNERFEELKKLDDIEVKRVRLTANEKKVSVDGEEVILRSTNKGLKVINPQTNKTTLITNKELKEESKLRGMERKYYNKAKKEGTLKKFFRDEKEFKMVQRQEKIDKNPQTIVSVKRVTKKNRLRNLSPKVPTTYPSGKPISKKVRKEIKKSMEKEGLDPQM